MITFFEKNNFNNKQLYAINVYNVIEILNIKDFDHENNFIKSRNKIIPIFDFSTLIKSDKSDKKYYIVMSVQNTLFALAVNDINNIDHIPYENIHKVDYINSEIVSSFCLFNEKTINILNLDYFLKYVKNSIIM